MYRDKGWVPAPTLTSRDDPNHKEMRALFDHAFRPSRIKQLDPLVEKLRRNSLMRLSMLVNATG